MSPADGIVGVVNAEAVSRKAAELVGTRIDLTPQGPMAALLRSNDGIAEAEQGVARRIVEPAA
jgi:hypothetical protein